MNLPAYIMHTLLLIVSLISFVLFIFRQPQWWRRHDLKWPSWRHENADRSRQWSVFVFCCCLLLLFFLLLSTPPY